MCSRGSYGQGSGCDHRAVAPTVIDVVVLPTPPLRAATTTRMASILGAREGVRGNPKALNPYLEG